jgi:hypothetical protein
MHDRPVIQDGSRLRRSRAMEPDGKHDRFPKQEVRFRITSAGAMSVGELG